MHPIAFGVVARALGVSSGDAASAVLLTTANAILQASMRLMRMSHRDVQAILHRLRPEIALLSAGSGRVDADEPVPLRSFHPLQEIASMRHARGNARLFSS
jgi:urease accessory protein UreF